MSSVVRRRAVVVLAGIVILGSGCGGDATGPGTPAQPQPPAGSATLVPRVLGLSTIDGKSLPAMNYTSTTYNSDAWTDSGSATLQDDSMLVIRAYTRWVDHGAGSQATATQGELTSAGRLYGDGIAILPYTNGTADTAFVRANGAIEAHLSLDENGTQRPFGTFLFARAYTGGTLNPVPYIRVISPHTPPEFADSAIVTLYGSSFLPTTVATWDKSLPLAVRYVNPNQLTVVIPAQYLLTAGAHPLTIRNPGPGGGDRIFQFPVTVPEPAIVSISPTSFVASGGDFTLHVHGRAFVQGKTQVLWNGSPHAAIVISPTDLTATIANADIAAAGANQVAVQTPPPGGGTSGVIPFTVTGTPAQKYAEVTTSFSAATLVADPARQIVYAFASPLERSHPNSVAAIDPSTGQIAWTLDLGGQVSAAAISDDGTYLYVVARQDSLMRISLATRTIDLTVHFPTGSAALSAAVGVAVVPGQPHSFVVVRRCPCEDDTSIDYRLVMYDDGQRRTQIARLPDQPQAIGFTSTQSLHADLYSGAIDAYVVDSTGIALQGQDAASFGSGRATFAGGRVYTILGGVYDFAAQSSRQLSITPVVNSPPTPPAAVAPSSDGRLLYTVGPDAPFVRAYDIATNALIGAVPYTKPQLIPEPGPSLVRWGGDGLAFSTGFEVFFIRASFVH